MSRSTKSLITILAAFSAIGASAAPALAGGYESINAITGGEPSDAYSSVSAIVGATEAGESSTVTPVANAQPYSSPAAVLGAAGVSGPDSQPVSSAPADGFDWGDALIGSAGALGLAGLIGTAVAVARRRRGPAVQPSV